MAVDENGRPIQYTKTQLKNCGVRDKDFRKLPPPTVKRTRIGRYVYLYEEEDVIKLFEEVLGIQMGEDEINRLREERKMYFAP